MENCHYVWVYKHNGQEKERVGIPKLAMHSQSY